MKKMVQVAFALTLLILSVLATFINAELFSNIVLGIIIPSFMLTIISFIEEVSEKCKANAVKFSDILLKNADLHLEKSKFLLESEKNEENAQKIEEEIKLSSERAKEGNNYANVAKMLSKCNIVLKYANLSAYVLLFLSMILSPYIIRLLSGINLNCITLWTLTILFVDIELKNELTAKFFEILIKRYINPKNQSKNKKG